MQSSARDYEKEHRDARLAMRISLLVGLLMLAGKVPAYWITGSSAIFSDPAESVVHVIAVRFAAFSLWLGTRLAISKFQYGYERTYAGALNTILGLYPVRLGKRNHSLILEVDGKHVLVDSWTSFGVIAGLVLVMITFRFSVYPGCIHAISLMHLFLRRDILFVRAQRQNTSSRDLFQVSEETGQKGFWHVQKSREYLLARSVVESNLSPGA